MVGKVYVNFKYTYTKAGGSKKLNGIAHGRTWEEALATINEHFPERLNIRRISRQR